MNEWQLVRASLERIRDQFALAREGKIRVFTLSVIVRGQAESLRVFRPDVAEPLLGLADAIGQAPRPDLVAWEQRFDAWRKDTLAVLVAEEAAAPPPEKPGAKAVAKPAAKASQPDAPAPERAVAAPERPAEPSAQALEPDGAAMSAEEIQRILDGLKKP